MTGEGTPLAAALGIAGARAVALVGAGTTQWQAGDPAFGPAQAEAVAALARAAAVLVAAADPADELGDVLVTSADAFHVLRPAGEATACLILYRSGANLALARQEFKQLTRAVGPVKKTVVLPKRRPNGAPVAATGKTAWFSMLGQTYQCDDTVLDRILVQLRHL